MILKIYIFTVNLHLLLLSTGWHSELRQSLQRHLRVLGVRLPDGPDLSDTSLLLGRHQSELPGEQLCLGRPQFSTALHGWKNKTQFFLSFFFILFRSPTGNVQRSGTPAGVCWADVVSCVCVCLKRCLCWRCILLCLRLQWFWTRWTNLTVCWSILLLVHRDSNPAPVFAKILQATKKTVIFFFFSDECKNELAPVLILKMIGLANWLDLGLSGPYCCFVFQRPDWHDGSHLISFVTDQTKMRQPPKNSLPIALRLYAIVCVVLLLVKLQLQKAAYPYCIVTIYLACVHWHSIAIWF